MSHREWTQHGFRRERWQLVDEIGGFVAPPALLRKRRARPTEARAPGVV